MMIFLEQDHILHPNSSEIQKSLVLENSAKAQSLQN